MTGRSSQNQKILAHLRQGLTLTPLQALRKFRCFRLSGRIYDLKQEGHDIRSRIVEIGGKRVARYLLVH